ncbi:MAG TPA: PEP-utilizing enzyme [Ilumatobacter sp.]|nr:PEP-utilizing enzyme [Ilumatobacter sp.]
MEAAFTPPGPGSWSLDRSHFPGGTTPIAQSLIREAMPAGMERVFAEIGAPIRRIDSAFVHGFNYTRVRPLLGGDRTVTKLPPLPLLKLASRVHPEFRRRRNRARALLRDKPFLDVANEWNREIRPRLRAANRAFQDVDLGALTDDELRAHVGRLLDHCRQQLELHFWLHGHDIGPIARLLYESERWGLDPKEVTGALAGASPSTARPAMLLAELRDLVDAAGAEVRSLEDVRQCSPEAAELLDQYLAERGQVLATGYDITSFTLGELPGTIVSCILHAAAPEEGDADEIARRLREQVPAAARSLFDEYLADARAVMDMRDDNGPLTAEWPLGLLRLALLEAGRRLVASGRLVDAEHTLELTPAEARRLFGDLPPADEIARRAAERLALAQLEPPLTLGPTEPEPPLDVLPDPLPQLVGMVQTAMRHLGMDGQLATDPLVGVGVGTTNYTGVVRTAASADEAIEKLEPGDVLVVRATSPAFNAVLTIAGAVVTSSGGAMSHAAVLARELGIPAVVGAAGALDIPDGATVEVDPVAGRVAVVDATVEPVPVS